MDHLSVFAKAIRQRPQLLKTSEDVDLLKRKLIVSQLGSRMPHVFPYVSCDLKAIQHRAPGALEHYEADPAFLDELCSEAHVDWKAAEDQSSYHAFQEDIKPPAGKELFAYFCGGRYDCGDILDAATLKKIRLYTHEHPEANLHIGKLIAAMSWPEKDDVVDETIEEPIVEDVQPEEDRSHLDRRIALDVSAPTEWNEAEQREHETIKSYKAEAGIGGRFDSRKVTTQILLGQLAPSKQQHKALKSKNQFRWPSALVDAHMYDIVDTYPVETIQRMVATDQAQDLYWAMATKPTDGRTLIKAVLNTPDEGVHKRYGKKWGNQELSSELVDEMIKL